MDSVILNQSLGCHRLKMKKIPFGTIYSFKKYLCTVVGTTEKAMHKIYSVLVVLELTIQSCVCVYWKQISNSYIKKDSFTNCDIFHRGKLLDGIKLLLGVGLV